MGPSYSLKPYYNVNKNINLLSNINININTNTGLISLEFDLTTSDKLSNIIIPKFSEVKRLNELWKSTCFECFIFYSDGDYYEFNLSPCGGWNLYHFCKYRQNMTSVIDAELISLSSSCAKEAFHIDVSFQHKDIRRPVSIQLCAVLSNSNKIDLDYWAIQHKKNNPDFHIQELSSEYRWL